MSLLVFLFVLQQLALALAIGSSTFSIIFYYKSIRDGKIDSEERSFMSIVYRVLRIGLMLIVISELLLLAVFTSENSLSSLLTNGFWFRWLLLGIIVMNAVLMDLRKMPMWLGPALAGASWYMYAIITTLARGGIDTNFFAWAYYYVILVAAFVGLLSLVQRIYVDRKPAEGLL